MTRRIRYANQLGISLFDLQDAKEDMIQKATLAQAILGTNTLIDGFACTPTSPASLTVNVGGGRIFSNQNVDNTAFGTLPTQIPADTTNQITKQAYTFSTTSFTITPPSTSGFSRNDLIQISFQEIDGTATSIPSFNGINNVLVNTPSGTTTIPIPNPSVNSTVDVQRLTEPVISIKNGVANTTGNQTTPTPDPGYVGAWVVTTANGQTTITSGNITEYTNAPFLTEKLTDKISQTTADARYIQPFQLQQSAFIFGLDTGTANAYNVNLSPAILGVVTGLHFYVKIANTNTGSSTIVINGSSPVTIKQSVNQNIFANQLLAGMIAEFFYDGSNIILLNPARTSILSTVSGTQNIAVGTFQYTSDTNITDPYGLWNGTGKYFKVPYAGTYRVGYVSSYTTSGVPFDITATLYKNGSQLVRLYEAQSSALDLADGASCGFNLAANDQMSLYFTAVTNTVTCNVLFQIEYIGS